MKDGGTAILNADDERVAAMSGLSKGKVVTYGTGSNADVRAANISFPRFGDTRFDLVTPNGTAAVIFPLNGRHNILNALAAAAAGYTFGMTAAEIANALASAVPPPQRGEVLYFADGFTVINDSYNSNPDALLSMVRTLVEGGGSAKRKIVVAGEMLELGKNESAIHRHVGEEIAKMGVDKLIGVRGLATELVAGARNAGLADAEFTEDSDAAARLLLDQIREDDLVLVKGSRGVRTEKVIEGLLGKFRTEDKESGS